MTYRPNHIGIYDIHAKVSHLVEQPDLEIDPRNESSQNLDNLPRLLDDLDAAISWLEEQRRIVAEYLERKDPDHADELDEEDLSP